MSAAVEALQWAVILFLGLLVLGCYRQLGMASLGSRSLYERAFGPAVDAPADEGLLKLFRKDLAPNPERRFLALFTQPNCPLCAQLLELVEEEADEFNRSDDLVHFGIVVDGSNDHLLDVTPRFRGAVVESIGRIYPDGEKPGGFPFVIVLDDEFRVIEKRLGVPDVNWLRELTRSA